MKCVHEKVGSDGDSDQGELSKVLDSLIRELWDLILPHMISLSTQSEGHSQQGSQNKSTWLRVFESAARSAFQKTLHLRTRLSRTNCEFKFLWPSPREAFDRRNMQTFAGIAPYAKLVDKRVVAFTSFPGLEATATTRGVETPIVACKAVVKLYPDLRDSEAAAGSDCMAIKEVRETGCSGVGRIERWELDVVCSD